MEIQLCSYEKKFTEMIRMKHYSTATLKNYLWHWREFKKFKSLVHETRLSSQDVNDYLVKLNESSVCDSSFNQAINAIRFMFKYVFNKKLKDYLVVRPKRAKTQPIILDQKEIQDMFSVCINLKHLAIFSILYSAALRCSEVINLKISDIDSVSMIIRIRSAKGRKDRMVPLDKDCLDILRSYYKQYKPKEYLFNGEDLHRNFALQYSQKSIANVLDQLAFKAGIKKNVYPHLIRHSSLTHGLEMGNDIRVLQLIAGHSSMKTIMGYTHASPRFISKVKTPFSEILHLNQKITEIKKIA